MSFKNLLPIFVLAIAIGWFMSPGNSDSFVIAADPLKMQVIDAKSDDLRFDSGKSNDVQQLLPDTITLPRAADGHFYADVNVNFGKVRFLVDTGASMVALTGEDARKLGLNWDETELGPVARGAGGEVRGKQIVIDKMQIGNVQANNVRAAIIPDGLEVSLLGQTFLARVNSVNIEDDQMVWN